MHIAASSPLALEPKDIPQAIVDKEQELVTEELKNSGKPDEIVKKEIATGEPIFYKVKNVDILKKLKSYLKTFIS